MFRALFPSLIVLCFLLGCPQQSPATPSLSLLDAVSHTLEKSPGVKIEKTLVTQKEGLLQAASGQFDLTLISGASLGTNRLPATTYQRNARAADRLPFLDTFREDTDTFYLGLNQQLRSGVSITPLLSTNSLQNNYDQLDMVNYSEASLKITVPLLKGLGVSATGADEMAAGANLSATRSLAKHNISRRVYATITAFWEVLGAQQMLETAMEGRGRADEFFDLIKRLIRGGELAPNLSKQVQANLLARDADLTRTRLSIYRSLQNLGLAMGQGPGQLSDPSRLRGELPEVPSEGDDLDQASRQRMVGLALKARLDYDAVGKDMDAARILVEKAQNFTLPDLKLSFKGGYSGLSETSAFERYYSSLDDNMRGLNFSSMLTLELPIQNNAARGDFVRRKAQLSEIRLRLDELANAIASEVLLALESVARARQEYDLISDSAQQYRHAVEAATARFKQGEGTVSEVLDQEDKFLTARLSQIGARQKYAVAMTQLRYATGTLLQEQEGDLSFLPTSLSRMPFADKEPAKAWTR